MERAKQQAVEQIADKTVKLEQAEEERQKAVAMSSRALATGLAENITPLSQTVCKLLATLTRLLPAVVYL